MRAETGMMRFESKVGHPRILPLALEFQRRGSTSVPGVVEIDPTTACNYGCPECISADLLNAGEMPSDRLRALLHDLAEKGCAAVVFIGGGEPLAHSAMPKPLTLAHDLGLRVGLTTNGYFVGRHVKAIAHAVDWTRVSMDAGTEQTYRSFRPNRDTRAFTKVVQGIHDLNQLKRGTVGYSFLLMSRDDGSTNFREIGVAAELAKRSGCDYFELKPSVDTHHGLIPWSSEERRLVAEQIEELTALEGPDFSVVYANSLQHLLEGEVAQPKQYSRCPSLELRTVVTPNNLYACPYKRGLEEARWSFAGDFDAAWNAGAQLRASINPSRDCSFYCIRDGLNRYLLAGTTLASAPESDDPFV